MKSYYRFLNYDLLIDIFCTALGVIVAAHTSSNITYSDNMTLFVVVLVLTAINVLLKPIIMLVAMPFIVMTFGIGMWMINAMLFKFVGVLVEGFSVATWGAAFWGALVVGLFKILGASAVRYSQIQATPMRPGNKPRNKDDDNDVIDI